MGLYDTFKGWFSSDQEQGMETPRPARARAEKAATVVAPRPLRL